MNETKSGFTIVELLIVIVVIGILAAITIVAYSGVQQRAKVASMSSDLSNAAKQLKIDQVNHGKFPDTLTAANGGKGLSSSPGTAYDYKVSNSANPATFCLTATNGTTTYFITQGSAPTAGDCGNQVAASNLVGWWKLNGNANDSSGNGNNGVVSGATLAAGIDGASNGAYSITNKNQVIDISNIGGSNITISMWYRYDGNGGNWNTLLCWDGGNTHAMLINTAGVIGFYNGTWYPSSYTLTVGSWYNLSVIKSGTNSKIYVNNTLVQDSNSSFDNNTVPFSRIGNHGGNDQGSLGVIDDVRTYNKALSASEVQAIYDAGAF